MTFEKQEEYLELIEKLKTNLSKYDMSIAEFIDSKEVPYFEKAWAINIRKSLDIGTASDEVVLLFREQNIDFEVPMLLWEEWYVLLKEHIKRNGLLEISKDALLDDGIKIGLWANRQIREFKKLPTERQDRFLACGLDLGKLEKAREERLEKECIQRAQMEKLVRKYFAQDVTMEQIHLFEKCVQEIGAATKSRYGTNTYINMKCAQIIESAYFIDSDVANVIWKYIIEDQQENLNQMSSLKTEMLIDIYYELKDRMGENDALSLLYMDKSRIEYIVRLRIPKARKLCKELIYMLLNGEGFKLLEEIFSEVCKFYPRDVEEFFENLSSGSSYKELLIYLIHQNHSLKKISEVELYFLNEEKKWDKQEFHSMFFECVENGYCNIAIRMLWKKKDYLKIEDAIECLELFLSYNSKYRFEVLAEYIQDDFYYEWLTVCIFNSTVLEKRFVEQCYNEKLTIYVLRKYLERGEFLLFKQAYEKFCCDLYAQNAMHILEVNLELLNEQQTVDVLEKILSTDAKYRMGLLLRLLSCNRHFKWFARIITKSNTLEKIYMENYSDKYVVKYMIYEHLLVRRIDKIEDLLMTYFRYSFWEGDVDNIWEIFINGLEEGLLSNLDCRKILKHLKESVISENIKAALEEKHRFLLFGAESNRRIIRNRKGIRTSIEKELFEKDWHGLSINKEYYLSCVLDTIIYMEKQEGESVCIDKCKRICTEEEALTVFKDILLGRYCLDVNVGIQNLLKIFNKYWGENSLASDEVFWARRQCIIDYWAITGAYIPFNQLVHMMDGNEGLSAFGLNRWILSEHANILKSVIYRDYEEYVLNSKSFFNLQSEIYNFERYHELILMSALIRIRRINYQSFIDIISGAIVFEDDCDTYTLYKGLEFNQEEILSVRGILKPAIISGIRLVEQIDENGKVIVRTCGDDTEAKVLVRYISRIINRELIAWTEMEGDTKSLFFEFMNSSELQYLSSKTKRLLYVTIMGVITDVIPYVKLGYSNAISDYKSSLSFQEHLKKIESIKRDLQEIITVYESEASEFEGMIGFCNEFNETLNKEEVKIREEIVKCFGEEVTLDTISDAKRVLIQNQNRLVVEDETELIFQDEEECEIKLLDMEKKILEILLWERDKAAEIEKLEQSGVYVGLLVNQINEKAMDKIGDVVICTDGNLSIYEEYLEECELWYHE